MAILLHACCGPCLAGSYPIIEKTEGSGNIALFWENPNIHPFVEYHNRRNSFMKMAEVFGCNVLHGNSNYGLDSFLKALAENYGPERCAVCYRLRIEAVAKAAADNSFSAFSTTLLISPYQNHDLLIATGHEAGRKFGVNFCYIDFRPGFRGTYEAARQHELYRQKYCGCIFSEHDRYKNDKKFLNPPGITSVTTNSSK
ncbi:MAG: epoxyqueuosine reductase QueH [Candidatus Riflebacteria bacterium]|nr:epoxyqueuosine reductase QueH [Candidatus Riflebacteria bacterium]